VLVSPLPSVLRLIKLHADDLSGKEDMADHSVESSVTDVIRRLAVCTEGHRENTIAVTDVRPN
jgi:hypothetical protein